MTRSQCCLASLVLLAFAAGDAWGQASDPYTLRLMMGNDAYVWESPTRDPARAERGPLVNPAARQGIYGRENSAALSSGVSSQPWQQSAAINPQAQGVLGYYGSQRSQATLARMPQRPSSAAAFGRTAPATSPRAPGLKPHAGLTNGPTVSPYLNLFRNEDVDSAPNYYAFVRPQQQQQEENRRQQYQMQRLQNQVRQTSAQQPLPQSSQAPAGRYGNTGSYFGGWR